MKNSSSKEVYPPEIGKELIDEFKQKLDLQNSAIKKLNALLSKSKKLLGLALFLLLTSQAFSQVATMTWVSGPNTADSSGIYGAQGFDPMEIFPGARVDATIAKDADGNVWVFGGFGYDADGTLVYNSDLWKWDGIWTWIAGTKRSNGIGSYGTKGFTSPGSGPGARNESTSWVDSSGNFWLFGGYGYDKYGNGGILNDLWKWDGTNWTWISGSDIRYQSGTYGTKGTAASNNVPGARVNVMSWVDGDGNFWLFGGDGKDGPGNFGLLNDLWKWDGTNWTWVSGSKTINQSSVYGTKGTAASSNVPGARNYSTGRGDGDGNFWLFGGYGEDGSANTGRLNDLWKWDGTNWTWISGSDTKDQMGVYGTKGSAASSNVPGGRNSSTSWADDDGNFWLFGGYGQDGSGNDGRLNDLWKWDGTNWTWITGADTKNQSSVHGIKGTAASNNVPSARNDLISWADGDGNFWLIGGFGKDYAHYNGYLNDLWKWDGTHWTWMSGSNVRDQKGVYGTKGYAASGKVPGARKANASCSESDETLWIYGGQGFDKNGAEGYLSDLWKRDVSTGLWIWMNGSDEKDIAAVYGTKGIAASANTPGKRESALMWSEGDNLWLFGGEYDDSGTDRFLNDLWKWNGSKWIWISGSSTSNNAGVYTGTTTPGSRSGSAHWIDASGNLWLFGGRGYDKNGDLGRLSDLWKFDGTDWTFVQGSDVKNAATVYGAKGLAASTNKPGSRSGSSFWKDATGNFWLFGGDGHDANGSYGSFSDVWKWDGVNWTWMFGSNTKNNLGVYGTQNVASAGNIPGARKTSNAWQDKYGHIWIFGGYGYGESGSASRLNDLWMHNGTDWIWIKGSKDKNANADYNTLNTADYSSIIGARSASTLFKIDNTAYIFGGASRDENGNGGSFNDTWKMNTDFSIENGQLNSVTLRGLTLSSTEQPGSALQDVGDYFKVVEASGEWVEKPITIYYGSDVDDRYERYWVFEKNDVNDNGGTVQLEFELGEVLNSDYSYFLVRQYDVGYVGLVSYGHNYKISGTKLIFTVDIKDIVENYHYSIGKSTDGPVYCVDFDGVNDYIEINTLSPQLANKSATFEGWFISENDDDALFAINTAAGGDKCVLYRNKYWDITYNAAASFTNAVTDNKWHHFALVINSGTSVTVYIDGKQASFLNSASMLLAADDLISIGQAFNGASKAEFLNGRVDEVRIWEDERTLKEIHDNMYRTLIGNESDLLAYYKCDQAQNALFPDYSNNSYSGLLKNFSLTYNASTWVPSAAPIVKESLASAIVGPGGALLFDGSDDRVETTLDVQPSAMATTTWEAWIYPEDLSAIGFQAILSSDDGGYDRALVFRPGKAKLSVYLGNTGSGLWTPDATLSEDKWTHVAVVYTPSNTFLYINGIEYEHSNGATGQSTAYDLFIGGNAYGHDFKGRIDEVRIWDDRRTQTEIQDNMHRALSTSEANLVAYYTFDQASGSILEDQVSNNDGTLKNFPGSYLPWVSAEGREPFKTVKSGNYALADNWKGGVAPNGTTDQLAIFHDLTINGNATYERLLVSSNSELEVTKSINVTGDVVVNGTSAGTNNIILSGGAEQCLAGSGTIGRLKVENSMGVSLEGDLTISENLKLSDGDIKINDHTLTLTGTTSHGSDTSYLKMNGSGKVKATVGSDPVILPIGRNPYLPITIDNGGDAEYTVGVTNKVYGNPESETNEQTGDVVSETWTIQSSSAVNDVIVTIQWDGAEEETGFNRNAARLSFWESGVSSFWQVESTTTATGSGPYSLSRTTDFTTNLYYFGIGSEGSALPVEMTYFNVQWDNERSLSAQLTWETSVEENNSHFEIQRSLGGAETNWQTIGQVQGQGTTFSPTQYSFTDDQLETQNSAVETVYYRLKQVDFSGQFEYSDIRTLHSQPKTEDFQAFPNPSKGSVLHLDKEGVYRVLTTTGQVLQGFSQTSSINVAGLAPGTYLIENIGGSKVLFVKQ